MDEFDKIKELSDDIIGRKEPSFDGKESASGPEEIDSPFKEEIELKPIDEVEEKSVTSFKWHFIALGIFVGLLAVVLSGFFLFGEDEQSDKIITISPTPEPVRVKPENAGGANIPNQDKLIYKRIQAEMPKVEQLFPEPEKPVLPERMILDPLPVAQPVAEPVVPIAPEASPKAPEVKTEPVIVVKEEPTPKAEVLPLAPEPVKPKVETPKKTAEVKKEAPKEAAQSWRIQLMSSPKKATVEKAWKEISQKHKALLSNTSHDIISAEIAGKGTFYRLQAGRFATRDQAAALCTKLKAQKQDCVPVKADK
ncbi:MAG: SPOR domain-containing protein [Alphaproteobacteria bacterium]|nr:SPOR domain-containing protein [Alphaproteobacteria bacterium]